MATVGGTQTIPWSWYSDPEVLRLEQELVFRRFWQYAARADQLAEPGMFVATWAGDVPVVLVRGHDRELRGFVNVCRHRGALVCEGEGRRETLQCPYHAWTYDLDGSLRAAPRADREAGIDTAELGLVPVQVEAWGPFVFVNPDPEAAPLDGFLGDVPQRLADGGIDVGALVFDSRVEADEYKANWKICVENYLECYHCQIAHPALAKAMDVSEDGYLLETARWTSTQAGAPRNGGGGVYDASGDVARGQFHFIFPNTVINVMPGHPNLSIGPIVPRGPERAYRFLDYLYAPGVDPDWRADYLALDDQVGVEDRELVERVHAGMRSGLVDHGTLLPRSEKLIAHFQSLVVEALGS